jgi:hypothetical protein
MGSLLVALVPADYGDALARIGSVGRPSSSHDFHPPTSARAFDHPARLSWSATRALVASSSQAQ